MGLDFGGHMRLTVNGSPLRMRGKFEIDDGDYEMSVVTNDDGSISQVGKPSAGKMSVTFEDVDAGNNSPLFDWNAFMLSFPQNVMVSEDDTSVIHSFTNAKASGKPKRNRLDGEVTGIEIHWPSGGYQMTRGS